MDQRSRRAQKRPTNLGVAAAERVAGARRQVAAARTLEELAFARPTVLCSSVSASKGGRRGRLGSIDSLPARHAGAADGRGKRPSAAAMSAAVTSDQLTGWNVGNVADAALPPQSDAHRSSSDSDTKICARAMANAIVPILEGGLRPSRRIQLITRLNESMYSVIDFEGFLSYFSGHLSPPKLPRIFSILRAFTRHFTE